MKFYLFLCISLTLACQALARNIVIPNVESTLNSTDNTPMRATPISTEPSCREMENNASRVCSCEAPFLASPLNMTCVEPFRQGPCPPEYFVVEELDDDNRLETRCLPNPCLKDGLVPYNKSCHNIITQPPCDSGEFFFNAVTSEITCFVTDAELESEQIIDAPSYNPCPPKSLKNVFGNCREIA